MRPVASQITGVSVVCSTVGSGADQRKHQNSASLAFVRGIHRWPVNSPHKGPVTRKMFPFEDVIMYGYVKSSQWIYTHIIWDHFTGTGEIIRLPQDQWNDTERIMVKYRADSRFAPSQWETALLCSGVSLSLSATLEPALKIYYLWRRYHIETLSALLALCQDIPLTKASDAGFQVFFVVSLHNLLNR